MNASGPSALALAAMLIAVPAGASGDGARTPPSAREGGTVYVVQDRRFRPGHEFRLAAGWLPQNAFYKGTSFDFSYAYHFSDFVTWEVLRGAYSWNHTTDLSRRLRSEFDVDNDPYEKAQYLLSTHVQFAPFYGKQALLERWIVHHELYATTGIGGVGWALHENGKADRLTSFRPAFDLGVGFRWYSSHLLSYRLEVIENLYFKEGGGIDDQVYVTLGVSLSTRRAR